MGGGSVKEQPEAPTASVSPNGAAGVTVGVSIAVTWPLAKVIELDDHEELSAFLRNLAEIGALLGQQYEVVIREAVDA